jgi:hypothetical protein
MRPSARDLWSLRRSDEAAVALADLARDVGWWCRWGTGGQRRGAARMLDDGELPLLVALAGQPRLSASGQRRMPLYSWLLLATDRRVILAHKWPLAPLRAQQLRHEDVVAMHAEPDRGEIVLVTSTAALRLCYLVPCAAERELIALLAARLPRDRVSLGAAELPPDAWELTAPESYLLRYAEHGPIPIEAFKLALKELVARNALRVTGAEVARKWLPGTTTVWLITDGPQLGSVSAPALTPVLEMFRHARDRHSRAAVSVAPPHVALEGVVLTDFATAAARRSRGFRDYLQRDVEGSLRDRGLLSARGRLVGEPRRTAAGRRANEDLGRWLDEGRRRGRWGSAEEPARALDYLRRAGAALLLLLPDAGGLAQLDAVRRAAVAESQAVYGAVGTQPADDGTVEPGPLTDDLGGIDLSALDSGVGALDGLDGAFGAIDASIAVLGGDGGGGDGGGG